MADRNTVGAPPREIHIEKKPVNWLAWLLLLLGLLALIWALLRHRHEETPAPAPVAAAPAATPPVAVEKVTLPGGKTVDLRPATLNYDLQRFLASADPAPRTFTFEKLNFDTDASAIRADDQPTLSALAQILAAYPNAKVKLTGYADARGTEPANQKLGADRAASVGKALTDAGVASDRVATASGGDSNPVATNATAPGQFKNRRTELTVTAK